MDKTVFGKSGESLAINFLLDVGYKIISRNFRCPSGEIDIVATDKDSLVFIEVKTRTTKKYGAGVEAVNYYKLSRIRRAGEHFMLKNPSLPRRARIEVVAIDLSEDKLSIKHIKDVT